mmetsp:Transcript_8011/g.15480  ORF Transcript_8011/g.15480 Transcript_8011/m.15480 type:complete len:243 (+) Transcript_8011:100-828(+)
MGDKKAAPGEELIRIMLKEEQQHALNKLNNFRYMDAAVKAASALAKGDATKHAALIRAGIKKNSETFKETMGKLWDLYDKDKDGNLSLEEHTQLMKVYMNINIELSQSGITDSIVKALTASTAISTSRPNDNLSDSIKRLMIEIPPLVKKVMKKYDTPETYKEVRDLMDTKNNGKVVKEDFVSRFHMAVSRLVDTAKINREVMAEVMSNHEEDLQSVIFGEGSCNEEDDEEGSDSYASTRTS